MTAFNIVGKKEKSALTHNHRTFNRLIKTLKDLQLEQEATNRDLDIALQFYYTDIKPDEAVLLQCGMERIKIAYQFYKAPQKFSKNELKTFKIWLAEEVSQFCKMHEPHELPDEIKEIFKELNGTDYKDIFTEESEEVRNRIQEEFKEAGIDVDLSDIDVNDPQEEIMRKVFLKLGQAKSEQQESGRQAKKTKKQLEKELKEQQFEETQAKSLNSIYKQLARVLHPDLEQNLEQRAWKEELMKKLTTAYKNHDLYSLLAIEMEWMNHSAGKMQSQNDEELKTYNTILRDQAKELQIAIDMLAMHPRYMPIQRFYNGKFDGVATLKKQHNELKKLIQKNKELILRLQTSEAKTIFRKIVQEQIEMQNFMKLGFMACTCGKC